MLIDFFYTLRAAKLPVSVKEFLTLLEALKLGVVGPKTARSNDDSNNPIGYKIDDFYFLSRATLVKDEKHYDKFDKAFSAYLKGIELVTDFTQDVPLDWLRQPTTWQPSVSNACVSNSILQVLLTCVRCTLLAYQV